MGFIEDPQPIIDLAQTYPEVEAVNAVARGVVMAQNQNIPAFPILYGVDVNAEKQVVALEDYLIGGTLDDLYDNTVFLSSGLARNLRASPGSVIDVFTPLMLEKMKADQVLLPRELEVAGIFETGFSDVDQNTMIITLRLAQELYGLGNSVHDVTMRLHDRNQAGAVATRLNEELPDPYQARTYLQLNEQFLSIIQMERTITMFISLFTVLVAAFSISSSLLTSVVRKTREIGLIGAMGGSAFGNAMIFTAQGIIIGCLGLVLGMGIAVGILSQRNEIIFLIGKIIGQDDFMTQYYPLAQLPVSYHLQDFVLVAFFAIGMAILGSFIPSMRAAKLRPAEALRNE